MHALSPLRCTPLHGSAQHGHREVCNALLAAGAQVNKLGTMRFVGPCLQQGCFKCHLNAVVVCTSATVTPLYLAAQNGHHHVCDILLAAGLTSMQQIFRASRLSTLRHSKASVRRALCS